MTNKNLLPFLSLKLKGDKKTMTVKECFIVCPISSEGTETRKRSDALLKYIITPACESSGYTPKRVDKICHTDKIDNVIIEKLKSSELVIADVTESNANAFFELGYRIATGKPVIQIAQEGASLPFDVMTTNTISYSITDLDKAEKAKLLLTETIKQLSEQSEVLSKVSDGKHTENGEMSFQTETILSTLYQIQNSIMDLKATINSNNDETITSIINAMHIVQPQGSPEMQMLGTLLQTPDGLKNLMQLAELSGKFPQNKQ
ncbi:MAG: hypothetical protein LBM93_02615 [Oscillospiraceae bacterium]|nr:hypothetical protein [Oscillospiraceae bacterium]